MEARNVLRLAWGGAVLLVGPLVLSADPPVHEPARALAVAPQSKHFAAASNEHLSQLVDLSLFGSFVPGLTPAEAEQRYGPPELRLADAYDRGYEYLRYRTPKSYVDVAYEPGGSSCATFHRRSLYATPLSQPWAIGDVLSPSLLRDVQLPTGTSQVGVAGNGERVWLLLTDGRVSVINWLRDGTASPP